MLSPSDYLRLVNLDEVRLSERTRMNYGYQWDIWQRWSEYRGAAPLPARAEVLRAYLAERAEFGTKPSSLRVVVAAISHYHTSNGFPNPADDSVRDILRAITNQYGAERTQAPALTAEALTWVRATACNPRPGRGGKLESEAYARRRGMIDIAILALMRDALLRVGEAAALRWQDLTVESDGTGRLHIARSKTDRVGRGAVVYVSRRTVEDLEAIRGGRGGDDAIFGLSQRQIINRIKAAAKAAGLGSHFSGHSARVGMAQDLVRAGTELTDLMNAGRWKSHDMPAHYTRNQEAGRGAVARYYGAVRT